VPARHPHIPRDGTCGTKQTGDNLGRPATGRSTPKRIRNRGSARRSADGARWSDRPLSNRRMTRKIHAAVPPLVPRPFAIYRHTGRGGRMACVARHDPELPGVRLPAPSAGWRPRHLARRACSTIRPTFCHPPRSRQRASRAAHRTAYRLRHARCLSHYRRLPSGNALEPIRATSRAWRAGHDAAPARRGQGLVKVRGGDAPLRYDAVA
jgi:hypothetical protein